MMSWQVICTLYSYIIIPTFAYIDYVCLFTHDNKSGDGGSHIVFILCIFLAEDDVGILDSAVQQCDQGIFVEWFGKLAIFFGGQRRSQ